MHKIDIMILGKLAICFLITGIVAGDIFAEEVTKYSDYLDEERGIHLKYPEGWHINVNDNINIHQLAISREPINKPTDMYRVGIEVIQTKPHYGKTLEWLRQGSEDEVADRWLKAMFSSIQSTGGEVQLLTSSKLPIGEKTGYLSKWFAHRKGGIPIKMIMVTLFYQDRFSYITLEAPVEEYDKYDEVFTPIVSDKELRF